MSPYKSLVPPAHSQIGTGAQNEQVCHHHNPLVEAAPLRVVCHCYSLRPTQQLETQQPRVLAPSYLLPMQGDFLDFSLIVWLIHLDPR